MRDAGEFFFSVSAAVDVVKCGVEAADDVGDRDVVVERDVLA